METAECNGQPTLRILLPFRTGEARGPIHFHVQRNFIFIPHPNRHCNHSSSITEFSILTQQILEIYVQEHQKPHIKIKLSPHKGAGITPRMQENNLRCLFIHQAPKKKMKQIYLVLSGIVLIYFLCAVK